MRMAITCALAIFGSTGIAASPPPISAFVGYAQYETVKISPDGKHLALTRRDSQHEILTVLTMPDLKLVSQSHFGDLTDIERVEWANNHRLLIQPMRRFPGFTVYKAPTGEIFGTDIDGKNTDLLFGFSVDKVQTGTHVKQIQAINAPARILSTLPNDSDNVLIQTYGVRQGDYSAAYRMNVNTGALTRIASSPVRNGRFVLDGERRIAFVHGDDEDGYGRTFYRSSESEKWTLIAKEEDMGNLLPAAPWGDAGGFLVLDNRDAPTTGVFSYTPGSDKSTLMFRNPAVDAGEVRLDPKGKAWMFVYDDHFTGYWYPDPNHPLAEAHQWLRKTFRGLTIDIIDATSDMAFAVARISSPRVPLMFIYVDVKNKKPLQNLAAYPNLKPEDLADVDPIEFKARDGLVIRGYLTMPNAAKKNLPLIVLLHGGPHGIYDNYGFDFESQLFASRGYGVLQVNYRGSGGRGRAFESAGYGKWGAEMQDDVTDAVKWAIADGVADPKRVCIYGGSYGAYAALTGAFREPELFRCAVGMSGVYDLHLMFTRGDIQTFNAGENYLRRALGADVDELKKRSPVYNAEKIKASVLLIHGRSDQRAPVEHAQRLRVALEKAGNRPDTIFEGGESHGIFNEENRAKVYERILSFFDKHIGSTK